MSTNISIEVYLRARAKQHKKGAYYIYSDEDAEMDMDAANTIESLRKELEECKAELEQESLNMRAENEYRDYGEDTSK